MILTDQSENENHQRGRECKEKSHTSALSSATSSYGFHKVNFLSVPTSYVKKKSLYGKNVHGDKSISYKPFLLSSAASHPHVYIIFFFKSKIDRYFNQDPPYVPQATKLSNEKKRKRKKIRTDFVANFFYAQ